MTHRLVKTPSGRHAVIDLRDGLMTLPLDADMRAIYHDDGALNTDFVERGTAWDCAYHPDESIGYEPNDPNLVTVHEW